MEGVKKGTVLLTDYKSDWANEFEIEKATLLKIFGETCLDIQHIGSTAIPKLTAKPLLDVAVKVADIDNLEDIYTTLNQINYNEKVGRLPGRHKVFAKSKNSIVTHHLHIIEKDNPNWDDKINFKDILIKNPDVLNQYVNLKQTLFEKYKDDRAKYTLGKSEFIIHTLKEHL